MVRGLGGHFCFDFFLLRFFEMSTAVLITTGNELEEEGTTGRGGGGGGGTVADCSTFFCGCGVGMGGGGGGDGATTNDVAGDATELSDPGLDATVAGLEEAPAVVLEPLTPVIPPLLRHPSNDPSWLGDNAPSELLSSPSGVT